MMTKDDDIKLLNEAANAHGQAVKANERWLHQIARRASPWIEAGFEVGNDEIAVSFLGAVAKAKARSVLTEKGFATEYVFRTVDESTFIVNEVFRVYVEGALSGQIGGLFADPRMTDRICDMGNTNAAEHVILGVCRGIRSSLLSPTPAAI